MKIAACQELFGKIPFDACCEAIASAGYTGIELAPFLLATDPSSIDPGPARDIARIASDHGLEIVAAHWLLASPPGMSITSPDPKVDNGTRTFFCGLIDVMASMGVPILVFGSPAQRNIDPSWIKDAARDSGIAFLADMADRCATRGMTIALEPLGPAVTNFAATCAEALAIIEAIDSPGLQLHLDVKAMHDDSLSPIEQIKLAGTRVAHVHVNDTNLLGPGMGDVDLLPIVHALRQAGYRGWYSVETFRDDVAPDAIARRSQAYLVDTLTRAASMMGNEKEKKANQD